MVDKPPLFTQNGGGGAMVPIWGRVPKLAQPRNLADWMCEWRIEEM